MSNNFVITSIKPFTPWERELFRGVYGSLAHGHGDIKERIARPPEYFANYIKIAPGYYNKLARQLLAPRFEWQRALHRARMLDTSITQSLYNTMQSCSIPKAHIKTSDSLQWCTCRQFTVCPGCRFRLLQDCYMRLYPHLKDTKRIGVLTLVATPEHASVPSHANVEEVQDLLQQVYRRKYNTWEYDVTVILPRYDVKHDMWRPVARIIALTSDPNNLYDIQNKIGPMRASQWKDSGPADPIVLAQTLARDLSYQATMLYRNRPALDLENIRKAFVDIRKLRAHGIKVYKKYKTLDIIRESKSLESLQNEEYNKLFDDGGYTFTPSNMAESSRYKA